MENAQPICDLQDDRNGFGQRHWAFVAKPLFQGLAFDELQNQIGNLDFFTEFESLDEICVTKMADNRELALEASEIRFVRATRGGRPF